MHILALFALRGKGAGLSPSAVILAAAFPYMAFVVVGQFPSISSWLGVSNMKAC